MVLFGLVAYFLALGADSVFDLVQEANGMGSAGILVLMVFGLFTRWGGARAGFLTLLAGLATWIYGAYVAGWTYPYLVSLCASLITFLAAAALEQAMPPRLGKSPQR